MAFNQTTKTSYRISWDFIYTKLTTLLGQTVTQDNFESFSFDSASGVSTLTLKHTGNANTKSKIIVTGNKSDMATLYQQYSGSTIPGGSTAITNIDVDADDSRFLEVTI